MERPSVLRPKDGIRCFLSQLTRRHLGKKFLCCQAGNLLSSRFTQYPLHTVRCDIGRRPAIMRARRRTQVVKGAVCKTAMQRFDPARRLQTALARRGALKLFLATG